MLAGAGAAAAASGGGNKARDIAGLRAAEQTWARALESGDASLLEALVDDELSFIGPDGQYEDRAAYLAGYRALPAQGIRPLSIAMDEVAIRTLGEIGIVTGRVLARVSVPGQVVTERVRFTRVYRRHGERWRMVAGQGTRLRPPEVQAAAPSSAAGKPR